MVIYASVGSKPFDIFVIVEVNERGLGNQIAQEKPLRQLLRGDVLFPVAVGFFQYFIRPLVERNDLATVQQFLKPQEFRVLLVQIPDGGRKGELVLLRRG